MPWLLVDVSVPLVGVVVAFDANSVVLVLPSSWLLRRVSVKGGYDN